MGFGRLARRKLARRAPKPIKLSKIGGRLVARLKRKKKKKKEKKRKKKKKKKEEKEKLGFYYYFLKSFCFSSTMGIVFFDF
jgi:hypothetical protein